MRSSRILLFSIPKRIHKAWRYFIQSKWTASIITNLGNFVFFFTKKIIINNQTVDTYQDFWENIDRQIDEDKATQKYLNKTFEKLASLLAKWIFLEISCLSSKSLRNATEEKNIGSWKSFVALVNGKRYNKQPATYWLCNFFSHFIWNQNNS